MTRSKQVVRVTGTGRRARGTGRRARVAEVRTPPQVQDAFARLLEHASRPLRSAVLTRWLHLAADVLDVAATRTLTQSASAGSDLSAVLASLQDPAVAEKLVQRHPALTAASIRGLEARQQVLAAEGGAWTVEQVARHLHLTRQAVDHRRRTGKLLALPVGRHGYLYPVWQFGTEGVLSGLEPVLGALEPHDAWAKAVFLLSPHPDLDGKTPVQALQAGRTAAVRDLADTFAEHGQS